MKERVKQFMACIGTLPPHYDEMDKETLVEGLKPPVMPSVDGKEGLLIQEVNELIDSIESYDILEIIDAVIDIQVYLDQIKIQLENAGISVNLAEVLVCDNNDEKYSTSFEFIEAKLIEWQQNDPWFAAKLRIEGNRNPLDGQFYYCLKDENNKVRKFVDFQKVDLGQCVPDKYKENN